MSKKLTSLSKDSMGIISKIVRNDVSEKLNELGIFEGSEVKLIEKLPFKGPLCIWVEENRIVLRHSEAKAILVK